MISMERKISTLDELDLVVWGVPYLEKVEVRTKTKELTIEIVDWMTDFLKSKHHMNCIVKKGISPEPDNEGNWISIFYAFNPAYDGKLVGPRKY